MNDKKDVNDRAKDGTLPANPSAETRRVGALRVVGADEKRQASEPCDLSAERALLGALLWAGANAPDMLRVAVVTDLLASGEAFYGKGHGAVYDAIRACAAAEAEHDVVAAHAQLVAAGRVGDVGGIEGLEKLKADASTVSERQARIYAKSVQLAWARRCAIQSSRLLAEMAKDPKASFDALVEQGTAAIRAMKDHSPNAAKSVTTSESTAGFFRHLQENASPAFATGLSRLDDCLNGGLRTGEVSVLAARTSCGKSTLAAQIAEHIVTSDPSLGVLYVTLEMSHEKFTARLVSARSGVPMSNIRRRVLNPSQWSQISAACEILARKGLYFTDSPSQTMAAIYATAVERARLLRAEGKKLAMVVLDYIGLVKPTAEALKRASREQQVAEISRGQRVLATELDIHVMGLAQIGREAEKYSNGGMPKLWHLKESGSIENDADAVLILHRERDAKTGLFRPGVPPALSLAKGRLDDTSVFLLNFEGGRARFSDWLGDEGFGHFYGH